MERSWDFFLIRLVPAKGESEGSPDYQAELKQVAKAVPPTFPQRAMTFDSVSAMGYPVGEWASALKQIAEVAVWTSGPVLAVLTVWIKAKAGRRVRIKLGDRTYEAPNAEELEATMAVLERFGQLEGHETKDDRGNN